MAFLLCLLIQNVNAQLDCPYADDGLYPFLRLTLSKIRIKRECQTGESHDKEGESLARFRPARGARTNRKGRFPGLISKEAAPNRLSGAP